ncbi:hypothetical protein MMC28_009548 [Mycoblastus sanguinarius]|nr:hypothetical protein [Mycoblastus sanguinarius]
MGGKAFASAPDFLIVRLPTQQYLKLRDHYQKLLLKFYHRTVVPPEAPEKLDHGDIDILADKQLHQFTRQELAEALDAKLHTQVGRTSSFAIRLPDEDCKYFQLDVHLCKKGHLDWETTVYSYGDLWHIIGATATRFGFSINDTGLHARIAEIEETNKKDCLLHLTSSPQEIMEFLGLNATQFEDGFATLNEVFEWATASRLFRRKFFEKEVISDKERRMRDNRPMYSNFVTEWLPQNHLAGCEPQYIEREDLLNEALERYKKYEEHDKMLQDHRKRLLKDKMWRKIEKTLPLEGKELGQAMVALKTLLWWKDGAPMLREEPGRSLEKVPALEDGLVNEMLLPWISLNWQEAVRLHPGKET